MRAALTRGVETCAAEDLEIRTQRQPQGPAGMEKGQPPPPGIGAFALFATAGDAAVAHPFRDFLGR